MARPQKELGAVARRIGRLDYAVYLPTGMADGGDPSALPWISYEDRMAGLPQWRWMAERTQPGGAGPPLLVNDAEAIVAAVKAGLGRSLLPTAVARSEPGLTAAGDGAVVLSRELWLMVHPDLRNLARVRAVVDWLLRLAGGLGGAA